MFLRVISDHSQQWMPPLVYLGRLMVVLPTCDFLPTHLIVRGVFRKSREFRTNAATSGQKTDATATSASARASRAAVL